MTDALTKQRRWQCRRGMLELDILLHAFFDAQYASLSPAEQDDFARLLDHSDQDLWRWLFADAPGPDVKLQGLVNVIRESHQAD